MNIRLFNNKNLLFKSNIFYLVIAIIFLVFCQILLTKIVHASPATRYWTGNGGDNNWNTAGNWDGGSSAPASGDNIVLDGGTHSGGTSPNKSITINTSLTLGTVTINGYTGTITQNSTRTITASSYNQSSAATFTGSSAADNITINGAFAVSSGTFHTTAGILTISSGNFSYTGGTFDNPHSGTLKFTGGNNSVTCNSSLTLPTTTLTKTVSGNTFTLGQNCSMTLASGTPVGTIINNGTLTSSAAAFAINGGYTHGATAVLNTATSLDTTAGGSAGDVTINVSTTGTVMPSLSTLKTGGALTLADGLGTNLTVTSSISIGGDLTIGTTDTYPAVPTTFNQSQNSNVTCNTSTTFNSNTTLNKLLANETLTVGSGCTMTFDSSVIPKGTIINNGVINRSSTGTFTINGGYTHGATGTLNNTNALDTTNGSTSGDVTINVTTTGAVMPSLSTLKVGGSLTLANNLGTNLTVTSSITIGGDLTIGTTVTYPAVPTTFNLSQNSNVTCNTSTSFNSNTTLNKVLNIEVLTIGSGCTMTFDSTVIPKGTIVNNGVINRSSTGTFTINGGYTHGATGTLNNTNALDTTNGSSAGDVEIKVTTSGGTVMPSLSTLKTGGALTLDNNLGTNLTVTSSINIGGDLNIGTTVTFPAVPTTFDSTQNAIITCNTNTTFSNYVRFNKSFSLDTITVNSGCTVPLDSTLTQTGSITNRGTINILNGTTFTINGGYVHGTTGNLTGPTTLDTTLGSTTTGNIVINATTAGGSVFPSSVTRINSGGDLTIDSSATAPTGLQTLHIVGVLNYNGTSFPNNVAITLDQNFTPRTFNFYSFTWASVDIKSNGDITLSSSCTTSGDFTLENSTNLVNPGSSYAITIGGSFNQTANTSVSGNNLPITMNGTNAANLSQTSSATFATSLTISKTAGAAVTMTSNFLSAGAGTTCTVTSGIFDTNLFAFTCGSAFEIDPNAYLRVGGSEAISPNPTLDTNSTVIYKGNGDGSSNTYQLYNWAYSNLTVSMTDSGDSLSSNTLGNNLYGYWNMDESSGSSIADSSGNSRTATATGTTILSSGGGALANFTKSRNLGSGVGCQSGVDTNFITLPNTGFDNFTTGITLSIWANPTAPDPGDAPWPRFFDLGIGQSNQNILFARNTDNNGIQSNDLTFEVYNGFGTGGKVTATNAITNGSWHNYTVTEDYAGNVTMYKDGISIATGTTAVPPIATRTHNYIGKSNWSTDQCYRGALDEARVYTRALSSSEVGVLSDPTNLTSIGLNTITVKNFSLTSGTFIAPGTMNITGNFSHTTGGTFNGNSGTVNLTGTSQQIQGDQNTTFYNLVKSTGSTDTLTFPAGTTVLISNNITLQGGNSSNKLSLVSSSPGSYWYLTPQDGGRTLGYLSVTDGYNNNSTSMNPSNSSDGGHNVRWFASPNDPTLLAPPYNGSATNTAITTGPTTSWGSYGNARCFNNGGTCDNHSGSYIQLPSGFNFHDSNNNFTGLTISVWANPTNKNLNWPRFIDLAGLNTGLGDGQQADNILLARNGSSDDLTFEVYNGSGSAGKVTAASAITENAWHLYTATEDTNGNVTLYKDGVIVTTGTTGIPNNIMRYYNYIGKSNWVNNDDYYQGYMDDMRVYTRSLSSTEITNLYHNINTTNGLYAYWNMNENSGNPADSAQYNTYKNITQPTFSFNATATTSSDSVSYEIQVFTDSGYTSKVIDYTSAAASQGIQYFTVGQLAGSGTYTTGSSGQTLSNGSYWWKVKIIDSGTATSYVKEGNDPNAAFIIDTSAPSVSNLTTTTPTNDNTPTWSWNSSDSGGSGISMYNIQYKFNSNDFTTGSITTDYSNTNSYTPTSLQDGIWYFRVQAIDGTSNSSAYTTPVSVQIDTQPPTTPGTPYITNDDPRNTLPTWNWVPSTDPTPSAGIADPFYTLQWSTDPTFATITGSTTTNLTSFTNLSPLTDGIWYARVIATDLAGNTSTSSNGVHVTQQTKQSCTP